MKTLLLLLLPAVLGNNAVKWCRVNERILGGERADKSEFPGLVYIRQNFWNGSLHLSYVCAGSVISEHWVLTGARCLYLSGSEEFRSLRVYPTKGSPHHIPCKDFIIHEEYDANEYLNDIALIRLPVPMSTIDPRSKITPIPEQDQNLTSNEVTLVGWGATSTTWMSPYLNKLEHVPLSQELCLKVGVSPDKALCRYPTHATGTACSFDDGGPIFMDGLQVGIVSEVPLFSSGLIPIDTRVSGYRDWIDENIRSHTS
ncbi:chymotrypsin-1 isoform X1 [Anabrus simplex]|uniref:chymotrypsin-1 isoform X1 n=1 Tax=Anabrus simplex TaxID=316456 RepID=UPI0035A2FC82